MQLGLKDRDAELSNKSFFVKKSVHYHGFLIQLLILLSCLRTFRIFDKKTVLLALMQTSKLYEIEDVLFLNMFNKQVLN